MPKIVLSDRPGHVRPYAALELKIRAALPDTDGSYEQALWLLKNEFERWQQVGEYQPTQLTRSVLTALEKRVTQRFVAGLVGIALYMMPFFDKRMSLENASAVVSEYANSIGKTPFVFWRNGEWTEAEKRVVGDLQTIRRYFRRYRNVVHICAAEVTCAGYLLPREPFDTAPVADACFIQTCLMFQTRFQAVSNFADWCLEEIVLSPPPEFWNCSPLIPDQPTVVNLFSPWLDRLET